MLLKIHRKATVEAPKIAITERVRSYAEATARYREHVRASGEGVSTFPPGELVDGDTTFHVSYNGRIWDTHRTESGPVVRRAAEILLGLASRARAAGVDAGTVNAFVEQHRRALVDELTSIAARFWNGTGSAAAEAKAVMAAGGLDGVHTIAEVEARAEAAARSTAISLTKAPEHALEALAKGSQGEQLGQAARDEIKRRMDAFAVRLGALSHFELSQLENDLRTGTKKPADIGAVIQHAHSGLLSAALIEEYERRGVGYPGTTESRAALLDAEVKEAAQPREIAPDKIGVWGRVLQLRDDIAAKRELARFANARGILDEAESELPSPADFYRSDVDAYDLGVLADAAAARLAEFVPDPPAAPTPAVAAATTATDLDALDDEPPPDETTTLAELVKIAADSVEALRGGDVFRVLNEARRHQVREPGLLDRMTGELIARRKAPAFLSYVLEAAANLDEEHGCNSLGAAVTAGRRLGQEVLAAAVSAAKERTPELVAALDVAVALADALARGQQPAKPNPSHRAAVLAPAATDAADDVDLISVDEANALAQRRDDAASGLLAPRTRPLPVMFPTVHFNGTGRAQLLQQLRDAQTAVAAAQTAPDGRSGRTALRAAIEAVDSAAPHGRDYYPQGDTAYVRARDEHVARIRALERIASQPATRGAVLRDVAEDLAVMINHFNPAPVAETSTTSAERKARAPRAAPRDLTFQELLRAAFTVPGRIRSGIQYLWRYFDATNQQYRDLAADVECALERLVHSGRLAFDQQSHHYSASDSEAAEIRTYTDAQIRKGQATLRRLGPAALKLAKDMDERPLTDVWVKPSELAALAYQAEPTPGQVRELVRVFTDRGLMWRSGTGYLAQRPTVRDEDLAQLLLQEMQESDRREIPVSEFAHSARPSVRLALRGLYGWSTLRRLEELRTSEPVALSYLAGNPRIVLSQVHAA